MQKQTIIDLINTKLGEHQIEIDGCEKFIETNKPGRLTKQDSQQMLKAQQLMIMKDKLVFHSACVKVLEDLKQEVEKLDEAQD
jgi:hypothetical protein